MARAPVRSIEVDERLRPTASPVDTGFKTPALADGGASNLQSLAQGLRKFDAGLNDLLTNREAEQAKLDAAQAETDFHKNNQDGYAKAVEKGLIPAYASKAYMQSYKETEGRNLGTQLQERFNSDYAEWNGKDSEDPQAYQKWSTDWLTRNLPEGTDPQVLVGLRPQLRTIVEGGSTRYQTDKDKLIKHKAETATVTEADGAVTGARKDGIEKGQVDFEALYTKLDGIRSSGLARGMTEAGLDPKFIDMVVSQGVTAGGSDGKKIIAYLDRKVPGKDYTFAQTPYGRDAKQKAIDAIDTKMRTTVREAKQLQTEKDKKEKEDLTRQGIEALIANPDAPIPDGILERGSRIDGSFKVDMMRYQETIRSNKQSGNRKGLLDLNNAIINGEGMGAVKAALDYGVITSKDELVAAYKLVQEVEKAQPDVSEALKGQQVQSIFDTIKLNTTDKDNLNNPFGVSGLSPAGLQAQHDVRMAILKWAQVNPNDAKDPIKLQEAISKIGAAVVGRISRPDQGPAQYDRSGFTQEPNPYVPSAAPSNPQGPAQTPFTAAQPQAPASAPQELVPPLARSQPQAAQPAAPAPQASQPQASADPAAAQKWYDTLPSDAKVAFSKRAAEANVPFADYLSRTYATGVSTGRIKPLPAAPTASTPPQASQEAVQPQSAPQAAQGGGGLVQTVTDALRSPADFISWLQTQSGPPGAQPSVIDAARNAMSAIRSPADFARWLTGAYDPRADLPAEGAAPASSTPTEGGFVIPAGQAPSDQPYEDVDGEVAKVGEETVQAVQKAIQDALTNPSYKPKKGTFTLSTIKNDELANRLADFVAGPESNGNYNAVWGKANSKTDLSKFTVSEILARQKATQNQGGQSATGRYQIIRKTLVGLVKTMGLSGEEKFTPELQDQMFMTLATQRGLEDYRSGKITLEKFANNLAHEWASLPLLTPVKDKKTGRVRQPGESAYSGDGLNKAHVTTGQVKEALKPGSSSKG